MPYITKIEPCTKRKNRINVFVDDEFFCAVYDEVCAKQKLKVGQEVDAQKLAEILKFEQQQKCDLCAVKYLEKYFKTKKEVENYLSKKGFFEEEIKNTIAKCEEYGYVSDQTFAKSFVNAKMRTCSKKQMEFELKQKGVKEVLIQNNLQNVNEEEAVLKYVEKYLKNKEKSYENITKLKASLFRKGFGYDVINAVVNKFCGENYEDWN